MLDEYLYQLRMSFNRLLYPLWFDADITLCNGGGAVLQQSLHQRNIIAVVLVDFRRVPLAEAVSADALIAQIITDASKNFLHFPCRDGEDQLGAPDPMPQTAILDILLNHERNQNMKTPPDQH